MKVFGIDISSTKGNAYALAENERITKTGIELNISRLFAHIDGDVLTVAWELPFVKKNAAAAIALSEVSGSLKLMCEFADHSYQLIPGANWQAPIKKAYGITKRPAGLSDHEWKRLRYGKYRLYLFRFLASHIKLQELSDDEVAASCIALHIARREKSRKLLRQCESAK